MKTAFYRLTVLITGLLLLHACKDEAVESSPIEFSDLSTASITEFSATLSSSITKSGSQEITDHGFAYSKTNENPEVAENSIAKGPIDIATPTPIAFSGSATGLEANTEYFARPYAITPAGTSFGKTAKFKTSAISQPGVRTDGAEAIGTNSAKINGSIGAKGTYAVSEYGLVWATGANPTTDVTTKYSIKGNISTFPAAFSTTAGSLTPNTTYNYRAYVISNGVTTYGENKTFKTQDLVQPGVRTDESKPSSTEAYLAGTLTTKGSHPITEYGLCWGSAANPTTSGSKQAFSGDVTTFPKAFNTTARSLNPGAVYYYRAYVIMNGTTTYGENKSFTTTVDKPSVSTKAATSITTVSATVNATINSQGSFPLSEVGIVWGTSNNPTTANSKQSKSAGGLTYPHNYSFNLTGLTQNTTYYFRAYAIVNGEVVYGSTLSFKTLTFKAITVTTSSTLTPANQGDRVYGTAVSGTYRIVRYGFYYNNVASSTFDFLNSKTLTITPVTPVTGTVNFNEIIPTFRCGNIVNYRAYAVDEAGNYVYGNIQKYSTGGCVN